MAVCGSLRSLFENPLPEKPTLIESLTWNQSKPKKPIDPSTFTELFGELHFHEKLNTTSELRLQFDFSKKSHNGVDPSLDFLLGTPKNQYRGEPETNGTFSPKYSESLQFCTEGLGSESSDDVKEEVMNKSGCGGMEDPIRDYQKDKAAGNGCLSSCYTRSKVRGFPPPISSIGRSGKPSVCFKSFREGGRFVLREIKIPTHEFLHACREGGRLKLHYVHPNLDIQEGEEEGHDGDEEESAAEGHRQGTEGQE